MFKVKCSFSFFLSFSESKSGDITKKKDVEMQFFEMNTIFKRILINKISIFKSYSTSVKYVLLKIRMNFVCSTFSSSYW